MALERQSIEKKDFPIGRRGYDPDAVDSHLAVIADQVDELRRSARRRTETLASAASDQVRAIVEAAESSAADISRQAEDDAADIRSEARREAQETRENATAQAREYVGRVSESTATMLQRIDAMESELGGLLEALRTGANRLNADLQLLEGNLTEVRETVAPRGHFEAEAAAEPPRVAAPEPPARPAPRPEPTYAEPTYAEPPRPEPTHAEAPRAEAPRAEAPRPEPPRASPPPPPAPVVEERPAVTTSSVGAGGDDDDVEGARLIALNMALNGTPREETDRYLAENFQLTDRGGLLEEVYASVEG